jgi:hypothetical protein
VLIACIVGGGAVIVVMGAIVFSTVMKSFRAETETAEAGATATAEAASLTPTAESGGASENTADFAAPQNSEAQAAHEAVHPTLPTARPDRSPATSSGSRDGNDTTSSKTPTTSASGDQIAPELRASELEVQVWNETTIPGARKTPFGRPPEAAPLIAVIEAVRDGDRNKFLQAHGFARLREGDSMDHILQSYTQQYGAGWKVSDFQFSFLGTAEKGIVATKFRGQMLRGRIFVAHQDGKWLIVGAEST